MNFSLPLKNKNSKLLLLGLGCSSMVEHRLRMGTMGSGWEAQQILDNKHTALILPSTFPEVPHTLLGGGLFVFLCSSTLVSQLENMGFILLLTDTCITPSFVKCLLLSTLWQTQVITYHLDYGITAAGRMLWSGFSQVKVESFSNHSGCWRAVASQARLSVAQEQLLL